MSEDLLFTNKFINVNKQPTKHNETIKTEFYKYIKNKIDTPIVMEDERLSSVSAKKSLILQDIKTGHNKALIDETAAAIFLQLYLDKN